MTVNKQYILQKLTSRKFIVTAVTGLGMVLTALNLKALTSDQISMISDAVYVVVAYLLGQSYVDGKTATTTTTTTDGGTTSE